MTQQNDTPWWDPDAQPSEPPSAPAGGSSPRRLSLWQSLLDWLNRNRHTALYMFIGLLLACGILIFGFGRTLLVAILVGAGYLIGSWRDGNPRLAARIQRFYERWINDNPFMK